MERFLLSLTIINGPFFRSQIVTLAIAWLSSGNALRALIDLGHLN